MDKRYQVFVSSTFTDLKEERKAIIEGLLNAKYIPAGMEMFAASNDEQFKYIKKIIDTCDYYVLIVGARYGSINPTTGKSFTEQEYDYAVEKGIPVLAFLHDDPYNLPADKRDDEKRELLEKFRAKVSDGRLCKMWHTSAELIASVIISVGEEVADNPQMGWTRYDSINNCDEDNRKLRQENKELRAYIKKLENSTKLTLDYEEKIRGLQKENEELKIKIDKMPKTSILFTKKRIGVNDRLNISYLNRGQEGVLYITLNELIEKIGDIKIRDLERKDFQMFLSKKLIYGEGMILKNDVEMIKDLLYEWMCGKK